MSHALSAGRAAPRRRALFGLLDADGWGWATVKAFFWFVVMIFVLAYLPDRAYYFTVNRTLELGLLAWSPVNLCPPENQDLPCPAPLGAVLPWEPSPAGLALPGARRDGAVAQIGTRMFYIGGSDGTAAQSTTYVATVKDGNYGAWAEGPALPEPRANAAVTVVSGVIYLIGGSGADGAPTTTVWRLSADPKTGVLSGWQEAEGLVLPAPRSAATAVALTDGIVVLGGFDASGAPTATVWKSTESLAGKLGAFSEQSALPDPIADAAATQVGDYLWVFSGTDPNGPSGAVQRGLLGTGITEVEGEIKPPGTEPDPVKVLQWAVRDDANLPEARADAAGFAANGVLYVVGGRDAAGPRSELFWTVPTATGELSGWKHLDAIDLPAGLVGSSPFTSGSNAFLIGGATEDGTLAGAARANLAPKQPFFQLGIAGAVIPALQIPGEIGQQLGYLAADGLATVNFIILLFIGWMYAHKPQVAAWWAKRRGRARG